uniref:NHLC3 protein n=1 Tax=Nothoprocta perdicaria TaxID=30464 RepID=A0A8C6ZB09_NOTPE
FVLFKLASSTQHFFLSLVLLHSFTNGSLLLYFQFLKAFDYSPWSGHLYKLDVGWPKVPEYFTGQPVSVAVDSLRGLVYVAQRGDNIPKVLVFSEEGYFLYSWNDTVEIPHGIFVLSNTTDSSVWITDVGTGMYGGDVTSVRQGRKC